MLNISNELREVILNGPRGDNRGYGAAVERLLEVRQYLSSAGKNFKSSSQLVAGIVRHHTLVSRNRPSLLS